MRELALGRISHTQNRKIPFQLLLGRDNAFRQGRNIVIRGLAPWYHQSYFDSLELLGRWVCFRRKVLQTNTYMMHACRIFLDDPSSSTVFASKRTRSSFQVAFHGDLTRQEVVRRVFCSNAAASAQLSVNNNKAVQRLHTIIGLICRTISGREVDDH